MVALVAGGAVWLFLRRNQPWRRRPLPIGGFLFAVATLEGLRETGHLVTGIVLSTVLLGIGGAIVQSLALGTLGRSTLAAPGIVVLLTGAGLVDPGWSRVFVGVLLLVATVSLGPFERRCQARSLNPGMVLFAISIVGLYEAVPDPDLALVMLGTSLPLLFLGWPMPAGSLGGPGWAAFGLLGWEASIGGAGRVSAVIGAVGCLGLFLVEPIATALRRDRRSLLEGIPSGGKGLVILAVVQLVIVYVAARVAGANPEHDAKIAVLVVAADISLATLAAVWVAGRAHPGEVSRRRKPLRTSTQ